ncbi:MAG: hypothetical protein WD334_05885 [Chitinophagales bacterium]
MAKLKEKLIEEIRNSNDTELLREIYKVLKESDKNEVIQLSNSQIKSIQKAEEEVNRGDFITQEQMNKDIDEWLKD